MFFIKKDLSLLAESRVRRFLLEQSPRFRLGTDHLWNLSLTWKCSKLTLVQLGSVGSEMPAALPATNHMNEPYEKRC